MSHDTMPSDAGAHSEKQDAALRLICNAVVDAVTAAGSLGAPGGHLYAALMGFGVTLDQFERLMAALVDIGKITKRGELYFAVAS